MTLCEENCELIEYNFTIEKAKCSCDIKLNLNYDIKFNEKGLYKNFIDIKNNNIMKCYKLAWKIKELKRNYGFFIILFILILYFITLFIFLFKSFIKLKKDINYINFFLKKNEKVKEEDNSKLPKEENLKLPKIQNMKNRLRSLQNKKINNIENINNNNNIINNVIVFKNENETKNGTSSEQIYQNTDNKVIKTENEITFGLQGLDNIYIKELLEQNDEAIDLDHRNYLQYYICLLRNYHPIIFSFAPYMDYNPRIIKIFLFFDLFNLCSNINVLFFNNNTIDKIYEEEGHYKFSYHIPQILYSALISKFIDSLIKYIASSQINIVELKKEKKKNGLNNNYISKTIRYLKIKFSSFFIITFINIVFFWYYITCFCGVFENTQKHFFINSILSLVISLLIPFVTYLIPGLFRISALRTENHNRKLLYIFSSFLEKLLH